MFDVGFWELAVIFVIGLLVLGPERLPRVAQQLGQWAGKARRMARILTTQLQDELNAIDPNRIMDAGSVRRPSTPPAYNRPGVENLIPGEPPAAPRPGETPGPASDSTQGGAQP
jgi:sec-independent protein translocase protein TatB